jgi:hypothetical protein
MTMRTRTEYACECGASAYSILSENDQPYSRMWERTEYFGMIDVEDRPSEQWHCRGCGQTGRVRISRNGAA